MQNAPVAQLDRVTVSEAVGRGFDSRRARHLLAALAEAALLGATLAAAPASAETFRCGNWIATTEMSVQELLEKCGEPTSKSVEVIDVSGPNVHGAGSIQRGKTTLEEWTYERQQSFTMVVTIVDGKIKSIERAE